MPKLRGTLCLLATFIVIVFEVATSQSTFAHAVTSASPSNTFVSFSTFLKNVEQAHYQNYASQTSNNVVQNEQAFNDMRSYILTMYAGVTQVSSYELDGQYFDCITTDSQPALRYMHIQHIAQPPQVKMQTTSTASGHTTGTTALANTSLPSGQKDAFGNSTVCADGTIPMERITLERVMQFPTLQAFLTKGPASEGQVALPASTSNAHRYAHAYQYVNNNGGNSWLNVWNPSGDFSISQQWYVGLANNTIQTVEGGWIHYPAKFGSQSVLFIFYTPDYYVHGCYNLDCPAFVQTNKNWALGSKFSNYSSYGGTQYGFSLQWQFYQGNWWLFLQGSAVGYYPGSLYNNGQLTKYAQEVDYGGETYTGGSSWPQMGSGKFASAGWQQAAFQNSIFYIDPTTRSGTYATLTPSQTNPSCYTINVTPSSKGGNWGTYFYFGGAGGHC